MKSTFEDIILILTGIFIGAALVFVLTVVTGGKPESVWHKRIVQHNCGSYDRTSGNFIWNDEIK